MQTQIPIATSQLPVPVNLTEEQINSILSEVPNPPGIGKSAVNIARKHLVERLRIILENIKLYPISGAFEEYKEELIKSLYEAYIEPGTSVGVTAGISLGGPVTQLSLNSFHFAGAQSGVALAFQKVRDFLTGSKMNRTPQMKVYFKVPYVGTDLHDTLHNGTFNSVMALRHQFEQTMMSDIVQDTQILTQEESNMAGVPQLVALHSVLRPERFTGGLTKFPLTHVVELHLNTYRMFTHQITMAMVARAIEGPSPPDSLTCVWRSQIDGRMYILVDETRDYSQQAMNQDMAILMFLHRDIIRKFGQWKISGISGIVSIEPQEVNVLKGIYRVRSSRQTPGTHYIYTNNRKTRWDGISLADIHRLILAAGFRVRPLLEKNKQGLYLIVDGFEGNFEMELTRRVELAQAKADTQQTEADKALINAATFHYALTNGTNMEEIVWRDDIDLFRTASNHSHEILEMLGIDAARIFLIFRFMQTLQDFSSYINPRHISLIFDLLCNLGIINSLSFVGINRRKIGPLAAASYERSLDVFTTSCSFGDKEAIVGVSPAIYVGQKSKRTGTGSIEIEEDLTAIPRDRPSLPTTDEDTDWTEGMVDADLGIFEGTTLADLMRDEDIRQTRAMSTIPVPVDKARIQNTTKITDEPQSVIESVIPSGARIILSNPTLVNALQKVSTGTGLIIEAIEPPQHTNPTDVIADIGETFTDITSLDDITGLSIASPRRFQPQPPPVTTGILAALRSIPLGGIEIPLPGQIPVPERVQPRSPTAVPLSPTTVWPSTVPLSPTTVLPSVVPLSPTTSVPSLAPPPIVRPPLSPALIIGTSVPSLAPPPIVRPPRPPVVAIESGTLSPGSFINLLPDLSEVTVPTSDRANVPNISVNNFINSLSAYQQSRTSS
jgi:hypothetical protein